jgi:hypothetical protein
MGLSRCHIRAHGSRDAPSSIQNRVAVASPRHDGPSETVPDMMQDPIIKVADYCGLARTILGVLVIFWRVCGTAYGLSHAGQACVTQSCRWKSRIMTRMAVAQWSIMDGIGWPYRDMYMRSVRELRSRPLQMRPDINPSRVTIALRSAEFLPDPAQSSLIDFYMG